MKNLFDIGDYVCFKTNPCVIYRVIGYSSEFIGIKSKDSKLYTVERELLELIPKNDERILEFDNDEEIFLNL